MSNFIPPAAISAATNSVVRPMNDAAYARKVQTQKSAHHAEDVEDVDEGGVDAVKNDTQGGGQGADGQAEKKDTEDQVEIASLGAAPPTEHEESIADLLPRLDISA